MVFWQAAKNIFHKMEIAKNIAGKRESEMAMSHRTLNLIYVIIVPIFPSSYWTIHVVTMNLCLK